MDSVETLFIPWKKRTLRLIQKSLEYIFDCNDRPARHFLQNYRKLGKNFFFFFEKFFWLFRTKILAYLRFPGFPLFCTPILSSDLILREILHEI